MNVAERGLKHVCAKCGGKYYDLAGKIAACPTCGTQTPAAVAPKPSPAAGRGTSRMMHRRYP